MMFTKKELLVRGSILVIGVLLFGKLVFNLNISHALTFALGAVSCEIALFVLYRFGIIIWRK
jgi:hypothetical protein